MNLSQRLGQIQSVARKLIAPVTLPFGGFQPDLASSVAGTLTAKNVVPRVDGFGPLPSLTVQASGLDNRCVGAAAAQDTAGNVSYYAGDAGKLYKLAANAFTDASKVGGYNTAADDVWEFALFGSSFVGTNFADPVQVADVGSASFSDLFTSTSKPRARHLDVVLDFLVLGNVYDEDGARPNRVRWSAYNNCADIDPSATTQSDYQDLPDGGWVQKVVGGFQYGTILQEHSIRRMTYSGVPAIFDIVPVDRSRGTSVSQSVIGHGDMIFFVSDEGFCATAGGAADGIGDNAVDRWFLSQFDLNDKARVSVAVDPVTKCVLWSFPGTGATGGNPNRLAIYNWKVGKWSYGELDIELLLRAMTPGYSLDQLDAFGNLDSISISLDSRSWTGGAMKMAAFDDSHRLCFFDGSNLAATIDTTDTQPNGAGRSRIVRARPLVDTASVTCSVASRATLAGAVTFGTASSANTDGSCPVMSEGRYHRIRTEIAADADWSHAQGVQADAVATGAR